MITKFAHIGAEVQNGQFAYVIIPGQDPIPTIVMGTYDSMVLVQGDAQTSWVDSEFIYEKNQERKSKMNKCPACEEVAEMKRYGWNDYFCRKHNEPIYNWIK